MSLEDFQLLDNERSNSITKIDFLIVYHQQGAQPNNADQNFEFIFVKIITIIKSVKLISNLT